ncbi:hypothetical protein HDIA_1208 [Hartmannibacter diazotrophicus]|uniref:Uncharacterized protein n=1 Tax=Hartmannibacter diazotrophicus TaxID=1482074 RepID=A0A2C9D3I9_9HYPH|nr:hypothetical protein [Hartmannibacter diazotrophicus]SON54749.1 hypothetical protein HDIA_1208 [Hartmannibacter diazotrophicus]
MTPLYWSKFTLVLLSRTAAALAIRPRQSLADNTITQNEQKRGLMMASMHIRTDFRFPSLPDLVQNHLDFPRLEPG